MPSNEPGLPNANNREDWEADVESAEAIVRSYEKSPGAGLVDEASEAGAQSEGKKPASTD